MTFTSFRNTILVAAIAACSLGYTANAQTATATLTQTGTGLNTFTILQGQQFQLTLRITTDFTSAGITYFLFHQQGYGGSAMFEIVARDMSMSPYPDATRPDPFTPAGSGRLNPANAFDLGATDNFGDYTAPGTYTIGILTLNSLANLSLGTHTIRLDRGEVTQVTGSGTKSDPYVFTDRHVDAFVTINVVPEPATVGLVTMGGGALLFAAWRKRRSSVKA